MTANLCHFAINADDVDTSRAFYQRVFGWTFTPWGPPGFYQIQTGPDDDPGVRGALQERRELGEDGRVTGLECTFAVESVDETAEVVAAAGGTLVMDRFTIAGVGHLIAFRDPSGNPVLAMEYDSTAE